ncbi:MAG: hypothetical protein ACLRZH_19080 [Ruthenibacterium lactatiformans]
MKCGGSDGLSGITANPAVGRFSDMLCARGAAPSSPRCRKCSARRACCWAAAKPGRLR